MALMRSFLLLLGCFILVQACRTYYRKNSAFNQHFEKGRFSQASQVLKKEEKKQQTKDRLLYYLNRGTVAHLLGEYEESNTFFEQAYIAHQDLTNSLGKDALAFFSNDNIKDYFGEEHEVLLMHYYKVLNFLHLGNLEGGLVECRRLDIKLHKLTDRYTDQKEFQRDAFMHVLIGIVYQANQEYNDAFIAYRNAIEIYEEDYTKRFGIGVPEQLKYDLLYTARQAGLIDEFRHYETHFGIKYTRSPAGYGELVCFWNSGLGPVKDEQSITFAIVKTSDMVTFVNTELGLIFPFPWKHDSSDQAALQGLSVFRIAYPKYVESTPLYEHATITIGENSYPFVLAENISAVATQLLRQRMHKELGKSLLRLVLKKTVAYQVGNKNAGLGVGLDVLNAITEQADTRNWQSLPHSIFYTRLSLPAGTHSVVFRAFPKSFPTLCKEQILNVSMEKNVTKFCSFTTLEYTEPNRISH